MDTRHRLLLLQHCRLCGLAQPHHCSWTAAAQSSGNDFVVSAVGKPFHDAVRDAPRTRRVQVVQVRAHRIHNCTSLLVRGDGVQKPLRNKVSKRVVEKLPHDADRLLQENFQHLRGRRR